MRALRAKPGWILKCTRNEAEPAQPQATENGKPAADKVGQDVPRVEEAKDISKGGEPTKDHDLPKPPEPQGTENGKPVAADKAEQEAPKAEEANDTAKTSDATETNKAAEDKDPKDTARNGTAEEAVPTTKEQPQPATSNGGAANILEKGVIYFFFRPRVDVEKPEDVNDIARSYIVLRPIPVGAKIGDSTIGDDANCRVLTLPKKTLPRGSRDRFLSFVEKARSTFKDLRDDFLSATEYETKSGPRFVAPTRPVAEGIYAITSTGRESHLAYHITIPPELGEVQRDLGLRERGSFVTSVKNPTYPSPAGASLPQGPQYPPELIDEFRGLRWKPLEPKFLDFVNTQFLLIGEGRQVDKALEQESEDDKEGMEKWEGEDEIRVKHLHGMCTAIEWITLTRLPSEDDAVFADLGLSSKDYPKVQTTW